MGVKFKTHKFNCVLFRSIVIFECERDKREVYYTFSYTRSSGFSTVNRTAVHMSESHVRKPATGGPTLAPQAANPYHGLVLSKAKESAE